MVRPVKDVDLLLAWMNARPNEYVARMSRTWWCVCVCVSVCVCLCVRVCACASESAQNVQFSSHTWCSWPQTGQCRAGSQATSVRVEGQPRAGLARRGHAHGRLSTGLFRQHQEWQGSLLSVLHYTCRPTTLQSWNPSQPFWSCWVVSWVRPRVEFDPVWVLT